MSTNLGNRPGATAVKREMLRGKSQAVQGAIAKAESAIRDAQQLLSDYFSTSDIPPQARTAVSTGLRDAMSALARADQGSKQLAR